MQKSMQHELLKGKTAIISGSTRGIGKAIAEIFAVHGAEIFINGRGRAEFERTLDEFRSRGYAVDGQIGDVSDENFVKNFAEYTLLRSGHIDILVNNAANTKWRGFLELGTDLWDAELSQNLRSAFLMCRHIVPVMKRTGGKIVNIGSISGIRGRKGGAQYAASKSGLIGFSRALAHDVAGFGINVNVVAPGFIDTQAARSMYDDNAFEKIRSQILLRRVGQPEDVAKAVLFFASPFSDFITGQVLCVDGGQILT